MPIRFNCQRCHQLLGIASRKAGSEIKCPKCGWSQVVPNEEAALAATAMDRFAEDHDVAESASSLMVYDDRPALIELPQPDRANEAASTAPDSANAGLPATRPQDQPTRPVPRGMILYPRRALYVQGLLLLILFTAGFGSGYLIGRGDAGSQDGNAAAAKERMLIEGNLVYDPGAGRRAGDRNAAIIALPQGKFPKKKISFLGIRPQADDAESLEGVKMIRQLGGEYTRADASGNFSLVVPDRGKYHVLIVSNHVARPRVAEIDGAAEIDEATEIDEADLVEMGYYFGQPASMIGRSSYCWWSREINDRNLRIDHDFGRERRADAQ